MQGIVSPNPASRALHRRLGRVALLVSGLLALSACSTESFLKQYNDIGLQKPAATNPYCKDVTQLKAEQLYGEWTLELPEANQRGRMRLSRHPEFSESLRGHIQYGPVNAIASGDVAGGKFDLDESSDGKRLTGTWSGSLPPAGCGDEIRGQWTELETNLSSSFVLYRVKPAEARPTAPAALSTRPAPGSTAARPGFANNAPTNNDTREDVDDLPNGVRVDRVPDPGLN